ncbi:hypothetical protein DPMN_018731 [Dreissena polymorpha]|uniref:Uncharacterized protein n=1 Tax=Dreissena polymorpha TaxID=45954 RepID=A0A9D4NJC3_DREPO|nr:hypothetical protein DPMN_018731 [Dreissena polymorpha]
MEPQVQCGSTLREGLVEHLHQGPGPGSVTGRLGPADQTACCSARYRSMIARVPVGTGS